MSKYKEDEVTTAETNKDLDDLGKLARQGGGIAHANYNDCTIVAFTAAGLQELAVELASKGAKEGILNPDVLYVFYPRTKREDPAVLPPGTVMN